MANREACEVFIEQEIKDALSQGKKPWTIGQELAKWVEKLFDAKINAKTIASRATRIKNKNSSNEEKKSKPPEIVSDFKPSIIDNRKPQGGGKREGAGRPPCNVPHEKQIMEANKCVLQAQSYLMLIHEEVREESLKKHLRWIEENVAPPERKGLNAAEKKSMCKSIERDEDICPEINIAGSAISSLSRITKDMPRYKDALWMVIEHIEKRLRLTPRSRPEK